MRSGKVVRLNEASLRRLVRNIINENDYPKLQGGSSAMDATAQQIKDTGGNEDLMFDLYELSSNDYSRMALNWLLDYAGNRAADEYVKKWIKEKRSLSKRRSSLSPEELRKVENFLNPQYS